MTMFEMAEKLLASNAELDGKVHDWLKSVSYRGTAYDTLISLAVHLFAEKKFIERVKEDLRPDDPLTWDELFSLKMIGKPVWSAEKREWMLIIDQASDCSSWIDLVDNCGKQLHLGPHDLERYQLYRKERE